MNGRIVVSLVRRSRRLCFGRVMVPVLRIQTEGRSRPTHPSIPHCTFHFPLYHIDTIRHTPILSHSLNSYEKHLQWSYYPSLQTTFVSSTPATQRFLKPLAHNSNPTHKNSPVSRTMLLTDLENSRNWRMSWRKEPKTRHEEPRADTRSIGRKCGQHMCMG